MNLKSVEILVTTIWSWATVREALEEFAKLRDAAWTSESEFSSVLRMFYKLMLLKDQFSIGSDQFTILDALCKRCSVTVALTNSEVEEEANVLKSQQGGGLSGFWALINLRYCINDGRTDTKLTDGYTINHDNPRGAVSQEWWDNHRFAAEKWEWGTIDHEDPFEGLYLRDMRQRDTLKLFPHRFL